MKKIICILSSIPLIFLAGCKVNVPKFDINIEDTVGGTFIVKNAAFAGEIVEIDSLLDAEYLLEGYMINGELITSSIFKMPEEDVNIQPIVSLDENTYSLYVKDNRFGEINLHKYKGKAGDCIAIDYFPSYGYVLDHFNVNNIDIGKNITFVLGHEDTTVEGVFKPAIEDKTNMVSTLNNNSTGTAYFTYELNDFGLKISAQVIDPLILNYGDLRYQDYTQVIITKAHTTQWIKDSTFSICCTSNSKGLLRVAVAKEMLSDPFEIDNNNNEIRLSSTKKSVVAKEGYSGYDTSVEISYSYLESMLGFNKNNIRGNVCFDIALNNAESDITYNWNCAHNWFNPNSYIVIH